MFLVRNSLFIFLLFSQSFSQDLKRSFHESNIVPDVIAKTPDELLKVTYPKLGEVVPGSTLTYDEILQKPQLSWNVDPDTLYTLYMVNPDVPSREEPLEAEWQHWTGFFERELQLKVLKVNMLLRVDHDIFLHFSINQENSRFLGIF